MGSTDPRVGTTVAGYLLEAVVGRGGMGIVYRAEDQRPGTRGRKVAVKLLAYELASDERFAERFRHESQTAASIEHPNIIPIYDAGEENGVLYIAMRYIEGEDLHELIQREGPLPADRALGIVAQAASALQAAHARGLVHRDVKPANILILPDPDPEALPHVYLTDFGLTKQARGRVGLTLTGQFVGTIDYVAPEQIQGRDVDRQTDVYALGIVLYHCLVGEPPFRGEEEAATLWAHISEPPPRVTERRPDLPAALDDVVARAMAKSPHDRFPTCRELVAAARAALGQPATPTSTPVPPTIAGTAPPVEQVPAAPAAPAPGWTGHAPPAGTAPPPSYGPAPHSWPVPPRRFNVSAAVVIGGAVALGVLIVLFVGLATRRPGAEPFPDDLERQLLARVPGQFQDRPCTRAPERPREASASIDCPTTTPQSFRFTLYPDATTMQAAYNARVGIAGGPPRDGDCSQGEPSDDQWVTPADDVVRGRVLCYRDGGGAVIVWTHDDRLILAEGRRSDGDLVSLYEYWAAVPDYS